MPWLDDAESSLKMGPPSGIGNVGPGMGVPKEVESALEYKGVIVSALGGANCCW
jgi:hypothetical protein